MSYGDASIIKGLLSAFHCYFFLFIFFNLQCFYIQNLAGEFFFFCFAQSATCHNVTHHLSGFGFVCKHCDIQSAHFATSYPGRFLLTQSAFLVFEGELSVDKMSNLLLFQQTLK